MSDQQNHTPDAEASQQAIPDPLVLGEVEPQELQALTNLKQQADHLVNQLGIHRVQEHRMIRQLDRLEQATNQIIGSIGERLGIPKDTAWSVTADGKAIQVGAPPPQARPNLQAVPDSEDTSEE